MPKEVLRTIDYCIEIPNNPSQRLPQSDPCVMPHLLRLVIGPDHRVLVPACVLGGGAYMVFCDLLARVIPKQGEMPAGVITALIGAPLFIYLLKRLRQ